MSGAVAAWLESLPGVQADHALGPHTTYRIGGPADWYLEAASGIEEIVAGCLRHEVPRTMLGNGSNVLVSDEGVDGLVLRVADKTISVAGTRVRAAAGARMVKVAQAAAAAGLTGFEWALGIPGMVGGSLHNNAGCFGSDMAATVAVARGVGADGVAASWSRAECAFEYRGSALREGALEGAVVTAVEFDLSAGDPAVIRARMEEIQQSRKRTQPVSGRSTGSVFKNPPGDFAGRLVEAAGMKGQRLGGAMVSEEHANFIVNADGASAGDVAGLIARVQAVVAERFGVRLQPEIQVMGRWAGGTPQAFLGGAAA